METMQLSLVGDVLISHRLPQYEGIRDISNILRSQDCTIGNLETTVRENEGYPESFPGGVTCFCNPACLKDLKEAGFKMFSTANNHSMDYSHDGLLATIKYLDFFDIPHAGTGKNLAEAAKAAHYETAKGRISLINVTSSFHDSYLAGPQNQDVCGRPGVAPLRHKALYYLPKEDYEKLSDIAKKSGINSYHDQAIKEGYLKANEHLKFGSFDFEKGEDYHVETLPLDADMKRTIDVIEDARLDSDVVVVSVHSHQFLGKKDNSPQFIEVFCRNCIDAGADIVFCHGPHLLRGIEAYHAGAILYGLGNFILQHEGMEYMPEEEYAKANTRRCDEKGVQHLFLKRNNNGTRGSNS